MSFTEGHSAGILRFHALTFMINALPLLKLCSNLLACRTPLEKFLS